MWQPLKCRLGIFYDSFGATARSQGISLCQPLARTCDGCSGAERITRQQLRVGSLICLICHISYVFSGSSYCRKQGAYRQSVRPAERVKEAFIAGVTNDNPLGLERPFNCVIWVLWEEGAAGSLNPASRINHILSRVQSHFRFPIFWNDVSSSLSPT